MVDRDPIEQLIQKWRGRSNFWRARIIERAYAIDDCADELDALLGSARLQKERKEEDLSRMAQTREQGTPDATAGTDCADPDCPHNNGRGWMDGDWEMFHGN